MRVRILTSITGAADYSPGQIVDLDGGPAGNLIDAGFAIPEPPSPSGVIATHLIDNGYTLVTPDPSGRVLNPPEDGGFYFPNDHEIRVVFPGREVTFELMRLKP